MTETVLLIARWAGRTRRLGLEQGASTSGDRAAVLAKNVVLRDTVEFVAARLACTRKG